MTTSAILLQAPFAATLVSGVDSFDLHSPLGIAVAVAAVEAVVIIALASNLLTARRRLQASSDAATESSAQAKLASLYDKALTGSLDRFAITEVIQFINSIRETGILDIVDERISAVHRVLVSDGEIIDAFNGDSRGEEALSQILGCREGSFTFIRGDLPTMERSINKPTMTLLMENMQVIDETSGIQPL